MEIRRVLRGETAGFAASRPPQSPEKERLSARPSADRLELSRQWVENMEEQRARTEAALLAGTKKEKKSDGILDMLDGTDADSAEMKAEMEQLKVQQRCMEISRRIMAGKKVPPQDERYLMEHDPEGYKITIALRKPPRKNEKECKSVLEDEEESAGRADEAAGTGETGESAPAEGSSGGGETASSGGEE